MTARIRPAGALEFMSAQLKCPQLDIIQWRPTATH
jgi:hypothetical protein